MARRGSRKPTPALINDSLALMHSLRLTAEVLRAWHPSLIALTIITQQIAILEKDLQALDTVTPAPAAGMFEEQA